MSEPIRLTFVSDTTGEFPDNTNASFKVRLPERMTLKGEGWYVSLWKITVPDHSQSSSVISSDMDLKVVKWTIIRALLAKMKRSWEDTWDSDDDDLFNQVMDDFEGTQQVGGSRQPLFAFSLNSRELTNRRLSHAAAAGSRHRVAVL